MMLDGNGLQPTTHAARIEYDDGAATITDGPFTGAAEIVAGYWLLQAESIDEIKDWMRRAPFRQGSIEIRQIFEAVDFGAEFTPELQERQARMREQAQRASA